MKIEHGSYNDRTFIGTAKTKKEAMKIAYEYIQSINFKSFYQRITFLADECQIDYGSYTDFIWIKEEPDDVDNNSWRDM